MYVCMYVCIYIYIYIYIYINVCIYLKDLFNSSRVEHVIISSVNPQLNNDSKNELLSFA